MPERMSHLPAHERGHEHSDVPIRPIAWFAVVFLAVGLLIVVGLIWLYGYFAARPMPFEQPSPLATRQQAPPPRLQPAPWRDMQEMRAAEDRAMNSYGWVDQKAGIVRIPVGRAIELLAQRGVPGGSVEPETKKGGSPRAP